MSPADIFLSFSSAFCAGACFFFTAWFVLEMARDLEIERREISKQLPLLFKLLMPLAPNFRPLVASPLLNKMRKDTRNQLLMAGYEDVIDEERLLCVNVLTGILGLVVLLLFVLYGRFAGVGLLLMILLILYPRSWLRGVVRRRHLEIQKALPNVLDLLTLSIEAGKDFLTSLRDILARRRKDALTEELERTFREIQLGKQRRTALRELAQRVQQPDLSTVINSVVQADELGVSIGQILRIQGDQLRQKRFNRAEKLANEAPVKILFPLAIFILPAVIIILLGPVLLKGFNILVK